MTGARTSRSVAFGRIGIALVVVAALVRAMTVTLPLPHFDADPRTTAIPELAPPSTGIGVLDAILGNPSGLGPTGGLVLDAIALLGAALAIGAAARSLCRSDGLVLGLVGLGTVAAFWHALEPARAGDAWIGSAWIAAWWGAAAAWVSARDAALGRLLLAGVAGFALVLGAKGMIQVGIDHPQTVASFEANRDAELAARGWQPGSASAILYERRLRQPEATGWFGLANVYASFMAGAVVLFGGLAWNAWRGAERRGKPRGARAHGALIAGGLGFLAASLGLVLSGSKGGYGAALLGVMAAVLPMLAWRAMSGREGGVLTRIVRTPRFGSVVAVGAVALVLAGIALRGLMGDAIGELSLRFRWFYLVGAGRVFADAPLLGVGPDGFQAAYLLARPALSPEEVTSPHSVLFDWAATLGVFGLAWGAALLSMTWLGGRGLGREEAPHDPEAFKNEPVSRARIYAVGGVAAGVMMLSTLIERGASVPLGLAGAMSSADPIPMWALLAGLGAWAGLGVAWVWMTFAAARGMGRTIARWAAGAMVAWVAVAMVDMAPIQPGSAGLFLLAIAAAAGAGRSEPTEREGSNEEAQGEGTRGGAGLDGLARGLGVIAAAACVGLAGFAGLRAQQASVWERTLGGSARVLAPIGRARQQIRQLAGEGVREREIARVVGEGMGETLMRTTGEPPADGLDELVGQIDRADLIVTLAATEPVVEARAGVPGVVPGLDRRVVGMLLEVAAIADREGLESLRDRAIDRAWSVADGAIRVLEASGADPMEAGTGPGVWQLRASVILEADRLLGLGDGVSREAADRAIADLERAHELDPQGIGVVVRLMELADGAGRREEARAWASRALELDGRKRLDPVRGLGVDERRRAERLAR